MPAKEGGAVRGRIADVASDINFAGYRNGVSISPFTCPKNLYEEHGKDDMIFYNIAEEGIVLYDAAA